MNDRQLRSFMAIAECGSLSKAVESTFFSRQALTKQMQTLENELGYPLMIRSCDGITLTPAGQDFYRRAKGILKDIEEMVTAGRDIAAHKGIIRILNPPHPRPLLEKACQEFAQRYPDIQMEIHFHTGDVNEALDQVANGKVDILECLYRKRMQRQDIQYYPLKDIVYHCVMHKAYAPNNRNYMTLSDLRGKVVCMNAETYNDLHKELDVYVPEETIKILSPSNEVTGIYNACMNKNIYISRAYYPEDIGSLAAIPLNIQTKKQYCVVCKASPSPAVENFIKVIKETMGH